jgi:hypothetical protein
MHRFTNIPAAAHVIAEQYPHYNAMPKDMQAAYLALWNELAKFKAIEAVNNLKP